MNLKEVLNYCPTCPIHQLKLELDHLYNVPDRFKIFGKSLSLCSHHRQDIPGEPSLTGFNFFYDGHYSRNSACPNWVADKYLVVHMLCRECKANFSTASDLKSILNKVYDYSFILNCLPLKSQYFGSTLCEVGTFDVSLRSEAIKYSNSEKFYHIDTDHISSKSVVRMGLAKLSSSLRDILNNMLVLQTPLISIAKYKNIDQIVEKLNLYSLFS